MRSLLRVLSITTAIPLAVAGCESMTAKSTKPTVQTTTTAAPATQRKRTPRVDPIATDPRDNNSGGGNSGGGGGGGPGGDSSGGGNWG